MITALIFAGGSGKRMNTRSKPKQFLEVYGKPIIISTVEHFENHYLIDNIVIVCIKEGIKELENLIKRYDIKKVSKIICGGQTGHDSIYFGLQSMQETAKETDIVLIHDGVRPLINEELITNNIEMVKKCGNAITCETVRESSIISKDGIVIDDVPNRNNMYTAKAPQSFYYKDIFNLYRQAERDNFKAIDSSHLCNEYNYKMYIVESTKNNIKITEPADYYIYKALYDVKESKQVFGL